MGVSTQARVRAKAVACAALHTGCGRRSRGHFYRLRVQRVDVSDGDHIVGRRDACHYVALYVAVYGVSFNQAALVGAVIAAGADIDRFTFLVWDLSHLSKEAQMAELCNAFWSIGLSKTARRGLKHNNIELNSVLYC